MKKQIIRGLAVVAAVALTPVIPSSLNANAASGGNGPSVNAQPVSKLKQGGTFIWAINSLPTNFNTSHINGNTADTSYIMGATLPGFFTVDSKGALVVDKNYATSVVLTSKKPQVVTYTINPKARWSDGKPVSLADFQGMWKVNRGTNKAYKVVSTAGYEDIKSVERGKKSNEVVVTFKKVYADWQGLFGGLLPASLTTSAVQFNKAWKTKPNVTAGPFQYSSTNKTNQTVTLVPNPKWWGDKPVLAKLVYKAVDPGAALDALANGEVDYVDIGPSATQYTRAKGLKGVRVDVSKAPNYRHLTFGAKTDLIKDVTIRRAVAMSLDRNIITQAMIGPIDSKATSLDNHVFVKGLSCYKNNSGIYGKQDYAAVDTMLKADGWSAGSEGNPRTKGEQTLELSITIPDGVPTSAKEAQIMQEMLDKAGIKLNIESVSIDEFFDVYITPGAFELTVFSWIGSIFPISGATGILKSDSPQNFGKIGNATIDGLLDKANTELDPVKRCKLANDADVEAWKVVHSLTTYQRPNVTGTDSKVANMGAWGFSSLDYTKIGFTK